MSASSQREVKVIGTHNEFVSYTHAARARKLVSQGRAFVITTDPYGIKLKGATERENVMARKSSITNFTQMFKDEQDIWVQNVGKTQISLQFESSPGQTISVLIPRSKKPFNLSTHVPWGALKNSRDLRIILNRRPAKLLPLTEAEAMEYFAKLAKANQSSAEEEIEKAFTEQTALMDHTAYIAPEDTEVRTIDEQKVQAEEAMTEEDEVNPRIIGLLKQADKHQPEEERMTVRQLKEELEVMEEDLSSGDLEYIINLAPKSIQKWASRVLSDRNPSDS